MYFLNKNTLKVSLSIVITEKLHIEKKKNIPWHYYGNNNCLMDNSVLQQTQGKNVLFQYQQKNTKILEFNRE